MDDNTKSAATPDVPNEAETTPDEMTEKQKKSKKIQKLIAFSLAALFVFQIIYEVNSFIPGYEKKYFIQNFSDHRETMEKWVDILTAAFDAEKETHEDLELIIATIRAGVDADKPHYYFRLTCKLTNGEPEPYEPYPKYTIYLPATEDDYKESNRIIKDLPNPDERFGSSGIVFVVTDKQVAVEYYRYAAVYSRSGWKPKYIRPNSDYVHYHITRISFHWYHVVGYKSNWHWGLYPD